MMGSRDRRSQLKRRCHCYRKRGHREDARTVEINKERLSGSADGNLASPFSVLVLISERLGLALLHASLDCRRQGSKGFDFHALKTESVRGEKRRSMRTHLLKSSLALVLLKVDQVLPMLVLDGDQLSNGSIVIKDALKGGQRSALLEGDGNARGGLLGRESDGRGRSQDGESDSSKERSFGEHDVQLERATMLSSNERRGEVR
jgi:hypothetical protein